LGHHRQLGHHFPWEQHLDGGAGRFPRKGMTAKLAPSSTPTVRVTEGFASAWKYRNIEPNTDGNSAILDRRQHDGDGSGELDWDFLTLLLEFARIDDVTIRGLLPSWRQPFFWSPNNFPILLPR